MNYCTKCQSIYSEPGTCNCYAATRQDFYGYSQAQTALPVYWCGACRLAHPIGRCPDSTGAPPCRVPENTCSTVALSSSEIADDVRLGRVTFTHALRRFVSSDGDGAADDVPTGSGTFT